MRIVNIIIQDSIKEKILTKHNIKADEIVNVLISKPLILKAKDGKYIAVGYFEKYLTIIFNKQNNVTNIITAYSSSTAQIKLYKNKRGL